VFSDSITIGRLSSDEGGEVNLVDIQTGELTTRKYRLISRRAKPSTEESSNYESSTGQRVQ